jgi:hypothetical protein
VLRSVSAMNAIEFGSCHCDTFSMINRFLFVA